VCVKKYFNFMCICEFGEQRCISARETAMTSVASFPFVVACIHYPLACLRNGRRRRRVLLLRGAGGAGGSLRKFRIVSLVRIAVPL
jgi:hypothetical protein